ncbi:hypothetical protein D3C77_462530 [compost metagenome]
MHPLINALQVVHLFRGIPQLFKRWRSRCTERIVGKEVVIVEESDFLHRRLGNQIENIPAGTACTEDTHHLAFKLTGERTQAYPAGSCIEIVEDAGLIFVIRATDQPRTDTGLQNSSRTCQDRRVSGHLGVVIRVSVRVGLAGKAMFCSKPVAEVDVGRHMGDA